ncbi:uncharacterized protein [Haliotis cracherodii]|uniref:uncharacterized protein n=1 Tax=Haliotis cracherodii TaxID=6455 RepID=UPI0039E8566B
MQTLIVLFISAVACAQCDSLTGKSYYIHSDVRTWNEARTICEDNGGRLAQIDNQQTLDALVAYSNTDHWKDDMFGHFWIGLNRAEREPDFRWDHCEAVNGSSFTFGDFTTDDTTKLCVYAEKDKLQWFSETCHSIYQYLCQKDTGPCTYTDFSGTCTGPGHAEASVVPVADVAECEDLCSNTLQNKLACWMYSYDNPTCTLYFDTDPWACTQPSLAATAKTRDCFTFVTVISSSSLSNSDSKPSIDCDLYTSQSAATSTPTTSITLATNPTAPATSSLTTTANPTTLATSSITMATNLYTLATSSITMATNPTTLTTSSITMATYPTILAKSSITMATNPTTPATSSITLAIKPYTLATSSLTMATNPYTLATSSITMATNPTILTTPSITMATYPTTPATSSITMATNPTILTTSSITMATNPTTPTTSSITMEAYRVTPAASSLTMGKTTTNPASAPAGAPPVTTALASTSTTTDSSGNSETCPCLVCVVTRNVTEMESIMEAILLLLKLDKSKLSATRRKLESEPDGRPSAQAIGYSGIIFIVITLSFFVLSDLMRLCQFFSSKTSNPQLQIGDNTA